MLLRSAACLWRGRRRCLIRQQRMRARAGSRRGRSLFLLLLVELLGGRHALAPLPQQLRAGRARQRVAVIALLLLLAAALRQLPGTEKGRCAPLACAGMEAVFPRAPFIRQRLRARAGLQSDSREQH